MNWLDKLERKLGHIGIRNLMTYIVGLNAAVFIMSYLSSSYEIVAKLALIPSAVMQGEVWRLVTFLFIPPSFSILSLVLTLYFYYLIGTSLEHEWGVFKFTVYYLTGTIATIASAFITGSAVSAFYLNLSLILAFAYIFPNFQILLFFILPIKIKYLAWFYLAFLAFTIIRSPFYILIIAASMLNFILFFGKDLIIRTRRGRKAYYNRRSFEAKIPREIIMHRCEICGRSERDDKALEFRYCVDCDGDHEYCMDHLNTHEHIKERKLENPGS